MSSPLLRPDGTEYRAFITGLIQTHEGVEIEMAHTPHFFRQRLAAWLLSEIGGGTTTSTRRSLPKKAGKF